MYYKLKSTDSYLTDTNKNFFNKGKGFYLVEFSDRTELWYLPDTDGSYGMLLEVSPFNIDEEFLENFKKGDKKEVKTDVIEPGKVQVTESFILKLVAVSKPYKTNINDIEL